MACWAVVLGALHLTGSVRLGLSREVAEGEWKLGCVVGSWG